MQSLCYRQSMPKQDVTQMVAVSEKGTGWVGLGLARTVYLHRI